VAVSPSILISIETNDPPSALENITAQFPSTSAANADVIIIKEVAIIAITFVNFFFLLLIFMGSFYGINDLKANVRYLYDLKKKEVLQTAFLKHAS
jgi:hypothetical protein